MPVQSFSQHNPVLALEKLDPRIHRLGHIHVNENRTTLPHPTNHPILPQQPRRKMDVIAFHPAEAQGVLGNEVPGLEVCAVDDGGVFRRGGDGRHLDFDGFDAVALVCADKVLRTLGGLKGRDGEALFVVCIDDLADFCHGVFFKCRVSQLSRQRCLRKGLCTRSSSPT